MTAKIALQYAYWVALAIGMTIAVILSKKNLIKVYPALFALVMVRVANAVFGIAILYHRRDLGLSLDLAYKIYFDYFWVSAVTQTLLEVAVIYGSYRVVMKPLEGLKNIGRIIFSWVACVSIVLSVAVVLGPHAVSAEYLATLLGQMQQGVSILTLCLMLFVCFAARPLGLTYRSRVFGVMLGMGIASTSSLVISTWFSTQAGQSLYSPIYLAGACCGLVTLSIWAVYFALPEPERALVLLPTTSPYFTWNRISEVLRDEPGMVVVSGFRPSMLASAELTAMVGAAKRPQALPAQEPAA